MRAMATGVTWLSRICVSQLAALEIEYATCGTLSNEI